MTTEFRKGLPSKAQVKAHEANGGLWEDEDLTHRFRLNSEGEITFAYNQEWRKPFAGSAWYSDSYRPLKADRTPLDWESLPDLDRQLDSLTQTLTLIREQDRARKRVCEDLEKRVRDLQAQVVAAIERAEKAEAKVRALEGVGQAKAGEGRFRNLEID